MPQDNGGPYVGVAVFCEKVLQEKDDIVSAIRIFDRLNLTVGSFDPSQAVPDELPPMLIPLTLLIVLRAGRVRGRHRLGFVVESPSGLKAQLPQQNIVLAGGSAGANVVVNAQFGVQQEGIYWFEITFDGDFLTKIPLEVVYLPEQHPQLSQS